MKTKNSAVQYAIYLLSRRDHSELELRQKLKQKDYPIEEIEQAVEICQLQQWQSDERFCYHFIQYRSQQGYGPRRLKQELRLKGVADWLIAQEIEKCDIDWTALAVRIFHKKCPKIWDMKAKHKMWRYMLSHGFHQHHFEHLMERGDDDNDWT